MTRFLRKIVLTGTFGLATLGLSPAAAQEDAAPVVEVAPQAAVDAAATTIAADPALWLVEDEDTKIYLFGTVHLLKPGLQWFDGAVKTAFDSADTAVFEVLPGDDQAATIATFQRLGTDVTGTKLRDRLEGADRTQYEAAMTALGIPSPTFDSFEPWMATMNLSLLTFAKAGFEPDQGVEQVLQAKAKVADKSMIGLETIEEQLGFLDTLPMTSQVQWLNETVDTLPEAETALDEMVTDWAGGEPEKLADLLNEGMSDPELRAAMLTRRNANWAKWIDRRLATPGTVFLAVGSGHLAGEDSVQQQLAQYGVEAKRIE
ncbi:TraB/GumN family protein [Novosphingopyxis sp.]|uniref:TraB/GumN family protein n=1 Tax=Novosphingopyxis sp. TaxID=2709690 RepID=UPI003B5A8A98